MSVGNSDSDGGEQQVKQDAKQLAKQQFSDEIARLKSKYGGGTVVAKWQNNGQDKGRYGPYAHFVAPPSAGREWKYLGKVNGFSQSPSSNTQTDTIAQPEDDFTEYTVSDYPENAPQDSYEFRYDSMEGKLDVEVEWRGDETTITINGETSSITGETLQTRKGRTVLIGRYEGEEVWIPVEPEIQQEVRDIDSQHNQKMDSWTENAEQWVKNQDLQFESEREEWETGTHRTKYTQQGEVLRQNKGQLNDREEAILMVLKSELGVVDVGSGFGEKVLELPDEYETGQSFDADDLVDDLRIEDEVQSRMEQNRENEQKRRKRMHIQESHPGLNRVEFDPTKTEKAFEKAKVTGEKQLINSETRVMDGNHPPESDVATVKRYATPKGEVETERQEHY